MSARPDTDTIQDSSALAVAGLGSSLLLDPAPVLDTLMPELARPAELANELATASRIQRSLMPRHCPTAPGFGLAGFCRSAREVGGDFYDALSLGEGSVLLVVADVMGKGVPAALFAASLRMLIRSLADRERSPADLLASLNRQMFPELSSVDMFITAQLALADTQSGILRVASAGHCPLLAADSRGDVRPVAPPGLPLGIQNDAVFGEEDVSLDTIRCALLYTDGLTETCDPAGNFYGVERLETWLAENADARRTAAQMQEAFLTELNRFQAGSRNRDDLTLMILAREGAISLTDHTRNTPVPHCPH